MMENGSKEQFGLYNPNFSTQYPTYIVDIQTLELLLLQIEKERKSFPASLNSWSGFQSQVIHLLGEFEPLIKSQCK